MLKIQNLSKSFGGRDVLTNVSLTIAPGEVVGLIGRSGAGKSTLAACVTGLERPDTGGIFLNSELIVPGKGRARKQIQYLWQDPAQSLSPYLSAHSAVLEALSGFQVGPSKGRSARATDLLASLGLAAKTTSRRIHALSGGQCQRVALARALAAEPDVLILDEPLSSLDLVTQLATIKLLRQLHAERGVAMLIVSHDLAPLRHLADRIIVLENSGIIEDIPMATFVSDASQQLSRAYQPRINVEPRMGTHKPSNFYISAETHLHSRKGVFPIWIA